MSVSSYGPPAEGAGAVEHPQVGRGWAFPPRWEPVLVDDGAGGTVVAGARVGLDEDAVTHLQAAMRLALRTERGSRVMRPTLGAGVDRYVFEARTADVCHRLAREVERTLLLWEPRVVVDAVEATPAGEADERIDVRIDYRIDRHRRPTSLVVPFYLEGQS